MRLFARFLLFATVFPWIFTAPASDWPEFRGPTRQGLTEADVPVRWSETEHVLWKEAVHGRGWSTPIVVGGKVWFTTATETGHQMSILCFDAKTGKKLLDRVFITCDNPEPLYNDFNCYASPSGVADGDRVWMTFGSYGTLCLDANSFDVVWERRDLTCSHWRGSGSSLALWEDFVIVTQEGADQQYSVALEKMTGKTVWRRDRSTDYDDEKDGIPANSGDLRKGYSTPIFIDVAGSTQMILNSSKACWGYDPRTGEELWQVRYPMHSPSSRCVYNQEAGLLYLNTGLGKAEVWAVRITPDMKGDVSSTHVAWTFLQRTPKRSSPVLRNGLLFMANDGVISCIDAVTGSKVWAERAGGDYSASVLGAKDRVYFFDQDGLCTVVRASREFEVLAENRFDDGFMGSPAVVGNALILRTKSALYRVE